MIDGRNLLFLISQPRSGSSLLQQLLMSTGEIKSVPEPWIMLAFTQVFRSTSNQDEFNPRHCAINFKEYLARTGAGTDLVKEEIRKLILKVYSLTALEGKRYFLDKTPRYYHILEEICDLFPESKIVVLLRNPVSVFASILDYSFGGSVRGLNRPDRIDDLYKAPRSFASYMAKKESRGMLFLRYEDLVAAPVDQLNAISEYLGLDFKFSTDPEYDVAREFLSTNAIDKKAVISNRTIKDAYLESWKKSINTREKRSLLLAYLRSLGPDVINMLGYDYKRCIQDVMQHNVRFNFSATHQYVINDGYRVPFFDFLGSKISGKLNEIFRI